MKLEKQIAFYGKLKDESEIRVSLRYQKEDERGIWADIHPVDRRDGFNRLGPKKASFVVRHLNRRNEKLREEMGKVVAALMPRITELCDGGYYAMAQGLIMESVSEIQ